MTNKTKITQERTAELKTVLRALAADKRIDLSLPANTWTMWLQREAAAPVAARYRIEFMRGAASAAELFAHVLQNESYVFQMLEQVLLLEAQGPDTFVLRECIAE